MIGWSLGVQEELLRDPMRRGRSLRDKGQLQVVDNPVHNGIVGDEGNSAHLCLALRTGQGIDLVDFPDHLSPAPAWDSRSLLLNDDKGMLIGLCLSHLAPVGVGVEAGIPHGDLPFIGNVGGDPGDELQIIHPLHLFRF